MLSKLIKPICPKGHDKRILGRSSNNHCMQCQRDYKNNPKIRKQKHAQYLSNKEYWINYSKEYHLKRMYGISLSDKYKLLTDQNNNCAICKIEMTLPQIDHDHTNGKIRGLLCSKCNQGLGLFNDNITSLSQAIIYLKMHKK